MTYFVIALAGVEDFQAIGPFDNADKAAAYAERNVKSDFRIARTVAPVAEAAPADDFLALLKAPFIPKAERPRLATAA